MDQNDYHVFDEATATQNSSNTLLSIGADLIKMFRRSSRRKAVLPPGQPWVQIVVSQIRVNVGSGYGSREMDREHAERQTSAGIADTTSNPPPSSTEPPD